MTAEEWLAVREVQALLDCPEAARSDRKLRLFCLACCRPILDLLHDRMSRAAIDFLEGSIDSPRPEAIAAVRNDAKLAHNFAHIVMLREADPFERARALASNLAAEAAYEVLAEDAGWAAASTSSLVARIRGEAARPEHADTLREILGNPFDPPQFDPQWRTSNVVSLAKSIYESRDFSLMPILADALQDASCDETAILDHCRGTGPHVKGCWVVDLVLGRDNAV